MNNELNHNNDDNDLVKNSKETLKTSRGRLKIFIGYAPGVGKTYTMLNEGNRRLKKGQDIIIGCLGTHNRKETNEQIGSLEIIPQKIITHNSVVYSEMDIDAILERSPEAVIIDELAHTNVPGSRHKKRYEDVEDILNQGIDVLSTLNIQHLESLNDIIRQITGVKVTETLPDKIVEQADEVVVVDLTPAALQNRLKDGRIFGEEYIDKSLMNFFRKGNLNALRELALRHTAEEVDEELEEYMKEHGIRENWHTVERVMVCISPSPTAKKLIRRGAKIAKRYKSEWSVVSVNCTHIFAPKYTKKDLDRLESHHKLAQQLGASVVTLTGKSVSEELSKFAMAKHITQIIIGHSNRTKLQTLVRGSTVTKLLKKTKDIEVHIIPNE